MTELPPSADVVTIDRGATRTGSTVAAIAAFAVVATAISGGVLPTMIATIGAICLGSGLLTTRRELVTAGTIVNVIAVVGAGLVGARSGPVLIGMAALLIAWDAGQYAIVLGEQVGADARTIRTELAHTGSVTLVVAVAAVGANLLFEATVGQAPVSALVALGTAVVALVLVLRE